MSGVTPPRWIERIASELGADNKPAANPEEVHVVYFGKKQVYDWPRFYGVIGAGSFWPCCS